VSPAAWHAGQVEGRKTEEQHRDPLRAPLGRRLVVIVALFTLGVAFVLSSQRDDPRRLPGVALDSPLLLDLERAAVIGAIAAGVLIFAIRGWHGYFPSKLSTSGAEYGDWSSTADLAEVNATVVALANEYVASAHATRETLERVASEISDRDDML
jgi:hypothetical protein